MNHTLKVPECVDTCTGLDYETMYKLLSGQRGLQARACRTRVRIARLVPSLLAMDLPYVINVSSDEEDEDAIEVLEFLKLTQRLIDQEPPKVVKKMCEVECPVCFDSVTTATATLCGHVYCLECLQKSISSSSARGQTRGKKGVGLCPMCRKSVVFKDTIVLRMKTGPKVAPPDPAKAPEAGSEGVSSPALHSADEDIEKLFTE